MSNEIDELIAKAKALTKQGVNPQAFKNEAPVGMPPLHYGLPRIYFAVTPSRIPISVTTDRVYIDIYRPSRNQALLEMTQATIVLHSHLPLHPCKPDSYCHEYGFQSENPDFKAKWSHFYQSQIGLNGKANLSFG